MRCVKGSTTVEMAYVMPLIFLVFLIIVRTTFYYHDKSILDGMAYEAVTTAVQTARNPKAKEADYFPSEESSDSDSTYHPVLPDSDYSHPLSVPR